MNKDRILALCDGLDKDSVDPSVVKLVMADLTAMSPCDKVICGLLMPMMPRYMKVCLIEGRRTLLSVRPSFKAMTDWMTELNEGVLPVGQYHELAHALASFWTSVYWRDEHRQTATAAA